MLATRDRKEIEAEILRLRAKAKRWPEEWPVRLAFEAQMNALIELWTSSHDKASEPTG